MPSTNHHDQLLTVEELADYVRCSTSSIYRWIQDGRLASARVGRRHLFRATDVEQLLGYMPEPPEPGPQEGLPNAQGI